MKNGLVHFKHNWDTDDLKLLIHDLDSWDSHCGYPNDRFQAKGDLVPLSLGSLFRVFEGWMLWMLWMLV
jgi:hypothetical protein